MDRRSLAVTLLVCCAVVVLLAGCSFSVGDDPADDATDSETPESANETDSDDGSDTSGNETVVADTGPINDTGLPVPENRVYNRTETLLGVEATTPTVAVEDLDARVGRPDRQIFDLLGLTNESVSGGGGAPAAAVATGPNSVVINEVYAEMNRSKHRANDSNPTLVLAHEFAHTIQLERGWFPPDWESGPAAGRNSLDGRLLVRSLIEGGAVYAAEEYAAETDVSDSQIGRFEQRYRTAAPERAFAIAPYHHGGQYFETALDSAADLGTVYEDDPPRTTTEILHPEKDDFEPTPVTFRTDVERDGWRYLPGASDTTGEMFVHVALSAHLDTDRADTAAAGYANDRLLAFEDGEETSYAWVTHWTSAEDAEQFATAFDDALDARSDDDADSLDLRFAGDRSVVVLAGTEQFREAVAIDGENRNLEVVISRPNPRQQSQRAGSRGASGLRTYVAGGEIPA